MFDFQLANLTQLPPTAADKARLPHLSDMLRQRLAASGRSAIASTAPLAKKAAGEDFRARGGCARDYARQLGVRLAVTGQIQKISNRILSLSLYIKDVGRSRRKRPTASTSAATTTRASTTGSATSSSTTS